MRRTTSRLLDTGPVLVLAAIAGAGSFTHIRDTAVNDLVIEQGCVHVIDQVPV